MCTIKPDLTEHELFLLETMNDLDIIPHECIFGFEENNLLIEDFDYSDIDVPDQSWAHPY